MITFLRKVRKSLLKTGPKSRYFFYAIGEIILVVIGILIALQINNWNEWKKDRAKEQAIQSSLLEDFKYNQERIGPSIEAFNQEIARLETSLQYIGLTENELTSEMKATLARSGYRSMAIAEGTLNSILSSDKLELILNEDLKKALTAYPAEINKFKSQAGNVKEIVLKIHRPILETYVSLTEFFSDDLDKYPNLAKHAVPSDYGGLLSDKKYQNALVDRMVQTRTLVRVTENFQTVTQSIIEMIETELQ